MQFRLIPKKMLISVLYIYNHYFVHNKISTPYFFIDTETVQKHYIHKL